ncbi:MAG: flagellar protein FlaG [Candidatus Endobugula sp.]|jgi:flagellar protein FlaG
MNEVIIPPHVTPAVPKVASAASSQQIDGAESLPSSGKKLPLNDTTHISKEAIQLNVKQFNAEQSNNEQSKIEQANIEQANIEQANIEQANIEQTNIEQAVTDINEYVQSVLRDLHFSVDEDSGQTVVRVRDKESGELIRQIPEDVFLSLAQNLKDNQKVHLFDAHG